MRSYLNKFIPGFLVLTVLCSGAVSHAEWTQPLKEPVAVQYEPELRALAIGAGAGLVVSTSLISTMGVLPMMLASGGGTALFLGGFESDYPRSQDKASREFTYHAYCQQTSTKPLVYTSILKDGNGNKFAIDLQKVKVRNSENGRTYETIKFVKTEIKESRISRSKVKTQGSRESSKPLYFSNEDAGIVLDENMNPLPQEKLEDLRPYLLAMGLHREYRDCTKREQVSAKNREIQRNLALQKSGNTKKAPAAFAPVDESQPSGDEGYEGYEGNM